MNYNLQLEQSLSKKVVAQFGYVGSEAAICFRFSTSTRRYPASTHPAAQNATRPFYGQFPDYTFINEIHSIGTSNYNSLQATLRVSNVHGFTAQAAYTWSHSMDEVTAYRGALPQDSTNFRGDYGRATSTERNIFVGLLSYNIPGHKSGRL